MSQKIDYIKAGGLYYFPQEKGVQKPGYIEGVHEPYCIITKLWFGRWKVEYYDDDNYHSLSEGNKHKKLIIYPMGIEEIRYSTKEKY